MKGTIKTLNEWESTKRTDMHAQNISDIDTVVVDIWALCRRFNQGDMDSRCAVS